MQHQTWNGEIGTQESNPAALGEEIRNVYGNDFTHVLQASWNYNHTLTHGEKMFLKPGSVILNPGCRHAESENGSWFTRRFE